ncbi:MAG TPA: glycosyltransferase [bacterium]|nr:glycosyltransferase [bacterium]HQL62468.1 glycosyltransferase [bacterium]
MIPMTLFLVSLALVVYTYLGYPLILKLLGKLRKPRLAWTSIEPPSVSVIIAAYNEEEAVQSRIANILASDYPSEKIEVLIASDGSTDRTVERAQAVNDPRVRALDFQENRGRAAVHNDAAAAAQNEILVFSDAESRFTRDFLRNITAPFADPDVGCTTGELFFLNRESTSLGRSRGFYWTFEYLLRQYSSDAGMLAVASGACMAVRRELYRPLPSPTDDVDFITPIDVVTQGKRVAHCKDAIVEEFMFIHPRAEFRSRVRMTARNWIGISRRLRECPLREYAWLWWCLISHKFLRWLTPFFLMGALLGSVLGWENVLLRSACLVQVALYMWALVGLCFPAVTPGVLGAPTGFCVANAGFAVGVLSAFLGRARATYSRREEQT